jgi:hypothetical protein
MGMMLAESAKRGEREKRGGDRKSKPDSRGLKILADLGLTKQESSRAQQLARLPDEVFARVIAFSLNRHDDNDYRFQASWQTAPR